MGGPDLDEIEKKSDDSHDRSAIDLINEAFDGQGQPDRERRASEGRENEIMREVNSNIGNINLNQNGSSNIVWNGKGS